MPKMGRFVLMQSPNLQGVKKCQGPPNPHLYQSLGVLAGEMGFVDEARAWFRRGTESIRVRYSTLEHGSIAASQLVTG